MSEVFDIFMRAKHRKYFEMLKKAILFDVDSKSASQTVSTVLDPSDIDLNKLICFRCISARRDTENKEGDNTLSSLSNRYYEKTKDDESNPTVANFEDALHSTDKALSGVYDGLFEKVIKKVKKFGGIRENETVVKIISTLSQQQLLKGNTTVVYESNNHQLPESYNGLGYLNLISIIMEVEIYLEDFLKKSNETEKPADINLLFIEEPEAHTHPQLQYVFIKNIKSLLIDGISDEQGNRLINLQTIITSHSSHIVSECDFDDIKYFKRSSNTEVISQNLKELETRYKTEKDPERNHFKFLLEKFKQLHDISPTDNAPKNLHNLKGEALENLVSYLLTISGNIFNVDRNLRTSTNEIDQIVTLTPQGKVLLTYHLIDPKLDTFLGECKNYDKAVSVTYIGKFCSLLLTNNIKIGILFSYYGTSGTGWSNGAGLIKKFYLHKEKLEDKYCIIDFSIKEFEAILNGKNLLQIIDEQLKSLQFDTDYSRYLSKHPAED